MFSNKFVRVWRITNLAMEEIFAEATTFPTNTTIITVVDALVRIVVPQLANSTVVPSRPFAAFNAKLTHTLC
jgi:hypothetical protein